MSEEKAVCELCGEPMPDGEEMFNYHGYSGPCPEPPIDRRSDTQVMRGRPVTHDEAEAAARRLIHSHFDQPGGARCSIPRDVMDDDLLILDYIMEQRGR